MMQCKYHLSPVSIIVAVDTNGGFGKDGEIPWNIPEDMKHFKETTKGGVCIMGRRTYTDMLDMWHTRREKRLAKNTQKVIATIPKEILPGRESFVVTSNPEFNCPGATRVSGIAQAIQTLEIADQREIFILGGKRMFVEALAHTSTIHMTVIKGNHYNCTEFFPVQCISPDKYSITNGEETDNCYFVTYTRKGAGN